MLAAEPDVELRFCYRTIRLQRCPDGNSAGKQKQSPISVSLARQGSQTSSHPEPPLHDRGNLRGISDAGDRILDPHHVESNIDRSPGLGLIEATEFKSEKQTHRVTDPRSRKRKLKAIRSIMG